ncbi:hypothetical protein VB780_08060 [Leptolyngbya sp. CCNP1308]|nr:hypothetical protein [Leptolyngbya sp. CCNP1308]MEA5448515.1 hypothetical protein [Leptolyngbya sp. CCNP1308]
MLREADLSGAIFGNNPGFQQSDEADLIARGAIFQDNPDSDVPALV